MNPVWTFDPWLTRPRCLWPGDPTTRPYRLRNVLNIIPLTMSFKLCLVPTSGLPGEGRLLLAPAALGGARSIRYTARLEIATVVPCALARCRFSTAYFVEIGNFAPLSAFLHIKGRNFPEFFLSIHVYIWPLWTMKSFMEIGPHVFQKSGRKSHRRTDRRGNFI